MEIQIGTVIKQIRKKRGITQDMLANALGITPQAISRWESQICYPDIEVLPQIAQFFEITVDELLGYHLSERKDKLARMKEEVEEYAELGEWAMCERAARSALKEYPFDYELKEKLVGALGCQWYGSHEERLYAEMEQIGSSVLESCKEIRIVHSVINTLTGVYAEKKESAKALALIERLPSLRYCKEEMLAGGVGDGKTRQYHQEAIEGFANGLTTMLLHFALDEERPDGTQAWAERVEALRLHNRIYEWLYGEDLMYYHPSVANAYYWMSLYQIAAGQTKEALQALEQMGKHFVAADVSAEKDRGRCFTSPYGDRIAYPMSGKGFHELKVHNHCYYALERISQVQFDGLREDARFGEIVERLKQGVK